MNQFEPSDPHAEHLAGADRQAIRPDVEHYSQAAGSRNIPRVLADGSLSWMKPHPDDAPPLEAPMDAPSPAEEIPDEPEPLGNPTGGAGGEPT